MGDNNSTSRYNKDYNNTGFYKSKAWRKVSKAYMTSKHYICERCGNVATICHHKTWLNGVNVKDVNIALSFDNLEALCIDCHNKEHGLKHNIILFDEEGNIEKVKENQSTKDFKEQRDKIDQLLKIINK